MDKYVRVTAIVQRQVSAVTELEALLAQLRSLGVEHNEISLIDGDSEIGGNLKKAVEFLTGEGPDRKHFNKGGKGAPPKLG